MGNIQILDAKSNKLVLAAHSGFEQPFLDFFDSVSDPKSVCGKALELKERVIVEDITQCSFLDTSSRQLLLTAGVLAVQTTPLFSRSGRLLGMLSTHCRTPHLPEDRDLRLFDLLARQVADIIERTHIEMVLRESEERYRNLAKKLRDIDLPQSEERFKTAFNANPAASAITRLKDKIIVDVNDSFLRLFGYSREEIIGRTLIELGIWTDNDVRVDILRNLPEQGYAENLELGIRKKSGETGTVLLSTSLIELEGEQLVIESLTDITQRIQMQEKMIKAELKFINILESIQDAFFAVDTNWCFNYMNDTCCEFYRLDKSQILGKNLWLEFPHLINTPFYVNLHTAMKEKTTISFENNSLYLDNTCFEIKVYPFGDGLSVYFRDITQRRKIEEEMARLDRLNLIGQMAAGIGHEVRNPMTTVKGFLQMLSTRSKYSDDKDFFDLMISELDRANSIISKFLSIARNSPSELERENLNQIISDLFPLLQADALNSNSYIEIEYSEIPDTCLNRKEIHQLILNMVRNSLEAMEERRCLRIKTLLDEEEAVLVIQDEGPGIDPAVLSKLGTPFLTTKKEGTGLGLATCFSIAERNNAKIEVESSSKGTTFYIKFKARDARDCN